MKRDGLLRYTLRTVQIYHNAPQYVNNAVVFMDEAALSDAVGKRFSVTMTAGEDLYP